MAITNKGRSWEIKKSLWIILNLVFLGGIGMFYAGKKVRVKSWMKYGVIYMLVTWISVIISPKDTKSIINNILMFTFFIAYIVCIIHSFKIRKEYLIRLEVMEMQKVEEKETDDLKCKVSREYGVTNSKISTGKLSNTKQINK